MKIKCGCCGAVYPENERHPTAFCANWRYSWHFNDTLVSDDMPNYCPDWSANDDQSIRNVLAEQDMRKKRN